MTTFFKPMLKSLKQLSRLAVGHRRAQGAQRRPAAAERRASVWSARSLLPLSAAWEPAKAPASRTHSKRFAIGHALGMSAALLVACSQQTEPAGHQHEKEVDSAQSPAGKPMCAEHNVPEEECGICRPQLAATLKVGESAKIRLAAADSAPLAGVQFAAPTTGSIADGVECYAELSFDQNKLAQIAAPVGGIIQEVTTDLGAKVPEKQVVARIWSAAIAEGVAKAVLTHQTLERERKLRAERVTSEKDLQQAEADHRAACQQARTLGFTEEDIDRMKGNPNEPVYLEVRAPFAGEIVERTAVRGALVEAGKPLFTLADRAVMWAMLNIPEAAVGGVKVGQTVELRVEALPGRTFTGKLTWIAAEVDEKSRMARARAEIANPDGELKARMFAQARILTHKREGALLLPDSAIQRIEGKSFVFVKVADDLFDARVVRLGARFDGKVEIAEGLKPLEQVAIDHAFPLKSAFLISRLGAGCTDD